MKVQLIRNDHELGVMALETCPRIGEQVFFSDEYWRVLMVTHTDTGAALHVATCSASTDYLVQPPLMTSDPRQPYR